MPPNSYADPRHGSFRTILKLKGVSEDGRRESFTPATDFPLEKSIISIPSERHPGPATPDIKTPAQSSVNGPTPTQHGNDVDVDPEEVEESYIAISRAFKKFSLSNKSTTDELDRYMRQQETVADHLKNIDKKGEKRTILHHLLRAPEQFKQRILLFQWVMEKHPKLYKEGIQEKDSILHVAAKRCGALADKSKEYLSDIVRLYPKELVEILKASEDQKELLAQIIPFIRNSAGPQFLEFFGACINVPDVPECACQRCLEKTAAEEKNPLSSPQSNIIEEKNVDVVILRMSTKGIVNGHSLTLSQKETKQSTKVGGQDLQRGDVQTPLHLTATYCEGDAVKQALQYEMVRHVYFWSPEALKRTNKDGHSPYLHRVAAFGEKRPENDKIAFFLKDRIMHLNDRDLVLDLLYGKPPPVPSANQSGVHLQSKTVPIVRQENEIHVDLREMQISAPSSSRKKDLLDFINLLAFEDILQYVQIPRHAFQSMSRQALEAAEAKPSTLGTGRRDFEEIFDVLYAKGVRKILKLIVDDDDACFHQDDVIEKLGKFEIEEFQWRKMDISTMVLRHGAGQARILHLSCSGNHSILRDWSSSDGLNQLPLLECVYVKIYWRMESEEQIKGYARDFIRRMQMNCPQARTIEVRLEPLTSKYDDEWLNPSFLVTTNKWLLTMQKFSSFLANARLYLKTPPREIKVAILDDGIDWSYARDIKCRGRSFYIDRRQDFDGQKVWYSSSNDHGTLMAVLVRKICPEAKLYMARLHQTETEHGRFQPTADSAAKAIRWAIQMRVHVISMSWTIPGDGQDLQKAVQEAHQANIIMFGSASDQGATLGETPFMAKLSKKFEGPVICIGGAHEAGYADEKASAEAEFFFPGQTQGIPGPMPHMKSNFGSKIGSSVATALASGLTALIMHLVDMSKYSTNKPAPYRDWLQNPTSIRKIFEDLIPNVKTDARTDRVIPVKKYFQHSLDKQLQRTGSEKRTQKASELLDGVVERILRTLIEDQKDKVENTIAEGTDSGSGTESDDD